MTYALEIRRGTLVITDPQRRCYNGCFASSHIEWEPWELWMKDYVFPTREAAKHVAKLFCRENQQLRVVEVTDKLWPSS